MMQSEAQRQWVTTLPEVVWHHPIAALIAQEQRLRLLRTLGAWRRSITHTTWTPPSAATRRGVRFFMRGPTTHQETPEREVSLREFITQADYLMDLLKGMLARCRPWARPTRSRILHNCVSDRWHDVASLASLADIDIQLCDTPLVGGGIRNWATGMCARVR